MNEESVRVPSGTAMKPQTAAKKLGIYLPATPEEFQANALTHAELRELIAKPPQWLKDLRAAGPHPRPIVAQKLGITITALKRNGYDKPLTTAEIADLLADPPTWLAQAREAHAQQQAPGTTPENAISESTTPEANNAASHPTRNTAE